VYNLAEKLHHNFPQFFAVSRNTAAGEALSFISLQIAIYVSSSSLSLYSTESQDISSNCVE